MDFEVYDNVLAYTLVGGDIFLHENEAYEVIQNFDDENDACILAQDQWGERFDFVFPWDLIIALVCVVNY